PPPALDAPRDIIHTGDFSPVGLTANAWAEYAGKVIAPWSEAARGGLPRNGAGGAEIHASARPTPHELPPSSLPARIAPRARLRSLACRAPAEGHDSSPEDLDGNNGRRGAGRVRAARTWRRVGAERARGRRERRGERHGWRRPATAQRPRAQPGRA